MTTPQANGTLAILAAGGRGVRMGSKQPKQFLELQGRPILLHTLEALGRARFVSGVIAAVPGEYVASTRCLVAASAVSLPPVTVIAGGEERQGSVMNALEHVPDDCAWVLVHDGVRPLVSAALLEATWHAAQATGAAIAALPATETVKRVAGERVLETLPRQEIWLVQTPQVFRAEVLRRAYREADRRGWLATDDASLVERMRIPVAVVHGERSNIKVTTPEDLAWARWFLDVQAGTIPRTPVRQG